jgi:signal transduction histidine kinase/ActR/RegA family two-component response regulator
VARLTLQQLLKHAQQLCTLSSTDDILAEACRGLIALTAAERGFATCRQPGQGWERSSALQSTAQSSHPVTAQARSALFGIHRRVAAARAPIAIARSDETAAMFTGLGCAAGVTSLAALPLVHRSGRLWGEIVLVGSAVDALGAEGEGIVALTQLATVALENAQRLAYARRDQDRLLLLAEATDDALWDWHVDTRDFWWGGGIVKLLGSNASPVENTLRWKLEQVHPEDRSRVEHGLDVARASLAATWKAEYRFRRSDGTYIQVEDRGYFLRDATGRAYRMLGAMRDVTALKTLLESEHRARAEAEAASRAKDEFLAMLGHELRNPLAPIVTGLDLIKLRNLPGLDRELTVIERQAQHLVRLVDDLLDISRIAHGKIELKRARLDLAGIIASSIEMASPLVEERRHTLVVENPAGAVEVDVDRARLSQAIGNLLTNAAKYTEPGGRITVRTERHGDEVVIRVRDTGIGIAPEMLPNVFQMFVQERQAIDRARGGLGLGLSIVRSLIELHGGAVSAHSEGRGKGSEFAIRLPVATTASVRRTTSAVAAASLATTGRRILVVDDNVDAAELLSMLLEGLGNTIRVANDPLEALALIDEFRPDVAVLDIGLPVMSGFELARRLRELPHTGGLRLIALSGYGQESDQRRAAEAGFDAHLVKPIEIATLDAVIQRLLGNGEFRALERALS